MPEQKPPTEPSNWIEIEAEPPSVQDILAKEGGFVVIEPGGGYELKTAPNATLFTKFEVNERYVNMAILKAVEYLNFPIIRDRFGVDHKARRAWRKEKEKEFSFKEINLTENNKLNGGKIAEVVQLWETIHALMNNEGQQSEQGKKLRALAGNIRTMLQNYHTLTDDEKIEKVKQIEEIIKEFLKLFER